MTIRFHCPSGHRLSADDYLAGQMIRCGKCRQTIRVPGIAMPDAVVLGQRRRQIWRLAAVLGGILAAGMLPVCVSGGWNLAAAPGWDRALVLLMGMLAAFVAWMLIAPDWASVRIVGIAFALGAAGCGTVLAIVLFTPIHYPLPLDLGEVRSGARFAGGALLALLAAGAWQAEGLASRWRRTAALGTQGR